MSHIDQGVIFDILRQKIKNHSHLPPGRISAAKQDTETQMASLSPYVYS